MPTRCTSLSCWSSSRTRMASASQTTRPPRWRPSGPSSTSWRRASPRRRPDPLDSLRTLVDELPGDLAEQAFTHASWVEQRTESYERLAFLGDVVLSLAISDHIYPRFPSWGAGRLTKLRAQAVSRLACAEVARELSEIGRASCRERV